MHIGILGGGQLGRMLALEGYPLGWKFRFYDPNPDVCARQIGECVTGAYEKAAENADFLKDLHVITYEFENIPKEVVLSLSSKVPVFPSAKALEVSQDRIQEKSFFQSLGIPVARFAAINSLDDLKSQSQSFGYPCILKSTRLGYDGKGQFLLRTASDCELAWKELQGQSLVLEGFVKFDREVSLISVRGRNGKTAFYPLVQNHHHEGILRLTRSLDGFSNKQLQHLAESHATQVLKTLDYVGVLTIEFFQVGDQLIANEMAPRVHNSGHGTWGGSVTSQFRNHLYAIAGWPLGKTDHASPWAMVNLIGEIPDISKLTRKEGFHWHLYGKEAKHGRKVGHITITGKNPLQVLDRVEKMRKLPGAWLPEGIV